MGAHDAQNLLIQWTMVTVSNGLKQGSSIQRKLWSMLQNA